MLSFLAHPKRAGKEFIPPDIARGLDLETSGLLIMTNDSDLAERLTNPDYKVPKTYLVKSAGLLTDDQVDSLRRGVELSDGPTRPAVVRRIRDSAKRSFIEITISEDESAL